MRSLKITKSITQRETPSFDRYLNEVNKEELITALEEIELTQKIKMGDQQALEKIVKANLRFVISVAKQYQNQGLSLPDLTNEGNLGLIKAAQRYDETRGFKFISYAVRWIRQSILQALAEHSRIVRLPLNKIGSLNKMNKAMNALEQEHNREPSTEEVSEALKSSISAVKDMNEINGRTVSLDKPINTDDPDGGTHGDFMKSEDGSADQGFYMQSLREEIARVLSQLSPREKEVIELYFGIGQKYPLTLEEIGHKKDVTRERVRQIRDQAIKKLKSGDRFKQLLRPFLGQ